MPIFKGNKETLGYTPLCENYVCCICFEELADETIYRNEFGSPSDCCKDCYENEDPENIER